MAENEVLVYSKRTGKKHRVPAHWVDHPVLGARFEKTPRQRDADKAIATAGGTRADHPDEPSAAELPTETALVEEPESKPAGKRPTGSTETPVAGEKE